VQEYFSNGRLFRLCLKELRESLRDRRTIITLVLMPILVYPLLSMALQRLMLGTVRGGPQQVQYIVGVPDDDTAKVLGAALRETQISIREGIRPAIEIRRNMSQPSDASSRESGDSGDANQKSALNSFLESQMPSDEAAAFAIVVPEQTSVTEALMDGQIDVAVLSGSLQIKKLRTGSYPTFDFQLEFRDGDLRSEGAMSEFRKAMQLVNDHQSALLRGPEFPVAVRMVSSATGKKFDATASLAGVLPLVLILMTITGAVYPAIDLTAGERERGTMEAMIATPAPRFVLLLSKYSAVVTVAVLTALANLFASWVTLSIGGLGRALLGERGFSFWTLLQILPLLVIFAAFFSAILLAMCSFARSFKEAQSYLIPVMLVSLAPALVTLMPNIEFSTLLGIVPLINILLLSRDIMTGSPAALPAFAAVLSTLLYAAAALVVASRLFGAESATAGSQETWSDLLRRPKRARTTPELGELAIYLALLFPVFFVATNLAGNWTSDIQPRLLINAGLLLVLFIVVPACFAWYRRLSFRETFLLSSGTGSDTGSGSASGSTQVVRFLAYLVSAVLLASGLWIVAYEALKILSDWGFATLSLERTDALEKAEAAFRAVPFWLILVTTAAIPAIAEEFFFRGFVLSAFRTRLVPVRAILYSALLFGVFHVINGSVLSIERFVPTTILGVALGTLALRTGALWPGILLHAIHNGLLFWLTRFSKPELEAWFGSGNEHFPVVWIAASALTIAAGTMVLFLFTANRTYEVST